MKMRMFILMMVLFSNSVVLNSCTKTIADPQDDLIDLDAEKSAIINVPFKVEGSITEQDAEALLFMWEEEKMAKEVYAYFFDKYKFRVFGNITKSETIHQQAVNRLITAYGLENPGNESPGIFNNQQISNLYRELISKGEKSPVEALKAGALIEETDILDLKERLNETENPYITRVFSNLQRASENHLRAFVASLRLQGISYTPIVLNTDYYSAIINRNVTEKYREKGYNAGN